MALVEARRPPTRVRCPWARWSSARAGSSAGGTTRWRALQDPTAHAEILALGAAAGDGGELAPGRRDALRDPRALHHVLRRHPAGPRCAAWSSGPPIPGPERWSRTARLLDGNPYSTRWRSSGGSRPTECGASAAGIFSQTAR